MQDGQMLVYSRECEAVFSVSFMIVVITIYLVAHPAITKRNHKGLAKGKAPFLTFLSPSVQRGLTGHVLPGRPAPPASGQEAGTGMP